MKRARSLIPPRGALPLPPAPSQVHPQDVRSILDEISDDFGVILWKAARAVDLWAQTPAEARRALFANGSPARWQEAIVAISAPPSLGPLVCALHREVGCSKAGSPTEVSALCLRLSEWAEGQGALASATAFAEAAALSHPRGSQPALTAGRLLKRRGAYARAETWLHRSLSLSIASGDWPVAVRAWSELGTVFALRGNLRAAEASHIRALRLATRHHLQQYVGIALHDLCGLCIRSGDAVRTQQYARRAIHAYYPGHPRLAVFASDLAYFWMLHGEFGCALQVFLAVLPHLADRREQLFVAANLIRAAGGAGRRDIFEAYWNGTLVGIHGCEAANGQAAALLDMARGAASLGERERAEDVAAEAVRRAADLGECQTVIEGDAVLDSLRRQRVQLGSGTANPPEPLSHCASLAEALEAVLTDGATAR